MRRRPEPFAVRPPGEELRPLETELKLEAPHGLLGSDVADVARGLGLELSPADKRAHVDRYLDTDGFDLARRGIGLRLRESEGHARLGVKLRGSGASESGVWRRIEVEEEVPPRSPLPARAALLPPALRARIQPVALDHPLHEVVRVATERSARRLVAPASDACAELCIDRVKVGDGPGAPRFSEVEIEDVSLGEATLRSVSRALQTRLGLAPSKSDKLVRALGLLGIELPPLAVIVPSGEMPFRHAACAVFREYLEALRLAEPEAREGVDPEGVHRMRVATRRLRAALRVFAGAYPTGRLDGVARTMKRTGDALGPVRDLDVMLIALPELAGEIPAALAAELEPLAAMLEAFHARERARLLRFLERPGRLHAMARVDAFVARGLATRPRGDGARPLREVAPPLLESAAARVWKRGDKVGKHSPSADLHRLRIAIKRLRYTAEMLAPLYGGELDGWLQRMTELQDVLGGFNDSGVAAAHLSGWIDTREGRRLPRRTLVAAGALLAHYEQRAQEARKGFKKTWRRFARPRARRELSEIARGVASAPRG